MTRETKVGIVVSSSFMCLVGAVVYTKYSKGEISGLASRAQSDSPAVTMLAEPTPVEEHKPTPNATFSADNRATPSGAATDATPSLVDPNLRRVGGEQEANSSSVPAPEVAAGAEPAANSNSAGNDKKPLNENTSTDADTQMTAPTWEAPKTDKPLFGSAPPKADEDTPGASNELPAPTPPAGTFDDTGKSNPRFDPSGPQTNAAPAFGAPSAPGPGDLGAGSGSPPATATVPPPEPPTQAQPQPSPVDQT